MSAFASHKASGFWRAVLQAGAAALFVAQAQADSTAPVPWRLAQSNESTPKQANCAQTAFLSLDGCSAAPRFFNPTLNFFDPNLLLNGKFFQYDECPSVIACPGLKKISWNPAGIAFAVGFDASKAPFPNGFYCNGTTIPCSKTPGAENLIDASAYPWGVSDPANTGCAPNDGDAGSGYNPETGIVRCIIGANHQTVNLAGFDWSPNEGTATENCLAVGVAEMGGGVKGQGWDGTLNFVNNRFKLLDGHPGCMKRRDITGLARGGPRGGGNGVSTAQSYQFYFFPCGAGKCNPDKYAINVLNNVFDGQGGSPWTLASFKNYIQYGIVQIATGGTIRVNYNWAHDLPMRVFDSNGGCEGIDVNYNVFHNLGYYLAYGHEEPTLNFPGSCGNAFAYIHNYNTTWWNDKDLGDGPQGDRAHGAGPYDSTIATVDFQLNLGSANLLDHWAARNVDGRWAKTGPVSGVLTAGDMFQLTELGPTSSGGNGSCSVVPELVWTGSAFTKGDHAGTCKSRPSSEAFYAAACVRGCAGNPSGVAIKWAYTNSSMAKFVIVTGKGGSKKPLEVGTLIIKNNATTTSGLVGGPPLAFRVYNEDVTCGATDYGPSGMGNFNPVTGASIPISYNDPKGSRNGC